MKNTDTITNSEDTIDSRDIIARIEYLREKVDCDEDEIGELNTLERLAEQGERADDWEHGEQLIRDSYFKNHAQELAEDCDMIPKDARWPMTCIDWDQAARELQMDYFSVDFDGETYWIR